MKKMIKIMKTLSYKAGCSILVVPVEADLPWSALQCELIENTKPAGQGEEIEGIIIEAVLFLNASKFYEVEIKIKEVKTSVNGKGWLNCDIKILMKLNLGLSDP